MIREEGVGPLTRTIGIIRVSPIDSGGSCMKGFQLRYPARDRSAPSILHSGVVVGSFTMICLMAISVRAQEPVITVQPACVDSCTLRHIDGTELTTDSSGSIAIPYNTTYSLQHLVGGDVDGDGRTDCRFIAAVPPPGAADDIVTFDGVPERIQTDVLGTAPTVTESIFDRGDGTRTIIIESSSPTGTELFPGGLFDDTTSTPLVDACLFLGLLDPLNDDGFGAVQDAQLLFLKDGSVLFGGPILLPTSLFTDPWNGRLFASFSDLAGTGINQVRLEIRVFDPPTSPVHACCVSGDCHGDIEESSCLFQGGKWQPGATCDLESDRPQPICDQPDCGYNNGLPLDDQGGPVSQYSPVDLQSSAGADDFILVGDPGHCRVTQVRAWMTHTSAPTPVNPNLDYEGVSVTVYRDTGSGKPSGEPRNDGSHAPVLPGGIVYHRIFSMGEITATAQLTECLADLWQIDMPVDILLNRNRPYWLEVQPIMPLPKGEVHWALSQNQNELPALEFGP